MGVIESTEDDKLDYDAVNNAAKTIRAVNHALSRQIIKLLDENKRIVVTDIYTKLHLDQSITSQRLRTLRLANVVIPYRDSRNIYYSLNRRRIAEIASFANNLLPENEKQITPEF